MVPGPGRKGSVIEELQIQIESLVLANLMPAEMISIEPVASMVNGSCVSEALTFHSKSALPHPD